MNTNTDNTNGNNTLPQRKPYDNVTDAELNALVMWPDKTVGHRQELLALKKLVDLADEIGYGRLQQLATQLEDLWRHPELIETYNKDRNAYLQQLSQAFIDYAENTRKPT